MSVAHHAVMIFLVYLLSCLMLFFLYIYFISIIWVKCMLKRANIPLLYIWYLNQIIKFVSFYTFNFISLILFLASTSGITFTPNLFQTYLVTNVTIFRNLQIFVSFNRITMILSSKCSILPNSTINGIWMISIYKLVLKY